jgi:hypothetical protein
MSDTVSSSAKPSARIYGRSCMRRSGCASGLRPQQVQEAPDHEEVYILLFAQGQQ